MGNNWVTESPKNDAILARDLLLSAIAVLCISSGLRRCLTKLRGARCQIAQELGEREG